MRDLLEFVARIYPLACAEALPKEAVAAFQDVLLEKTIEHARANSVFWSERIPKDICANYRGALSRIPLISRDELQLEFQRNISTPKSDSREIYHTTGTTGEKPISICRSSDEICFLNQLYSDLARRLALSAEGLRPRWISTCDTQAHGRTIVVESYAFKDLFDNSGRTSEVLAKEILQYFSRPPYVSGVEDSVSVLSTTSSFVSYLTYIARETKSFCVPISMRHIFHGSSYMLNRARRAIEEFWGARLHDVYSMTEMIGCGVRENNSTYFRFQPATIFEIVDPTNLCSLASGMGRLVLTCLFPFVQFQPRIRYLTTDLFEIREDRLQYVGRLQNSAPILAKNGTLQPRIKPVEFYECVNEIPTIFRALVIDGCIWPDHDLGTPAVKVSTDEIDPRRFRIEAAVTFDVQADMAKTRIVEDHIKTAIISSAITNSGREFINPDLIEVEIFAASEMVGLVQLIPSKI